MALMKDS